MKHQRFALSTSSVLTIGLFVLIALTVHFYVIVMDIERTMPSRSGSVPAAIDTMKKRVVRLGVISRYPPTIMYRGYQPIMDYLTAQTPYRFELLLSQDYNEALNLLIARKVAAVFLGSYLYLKAHERYGVIPILKPLNENQKPVSRSVLFVRKDSPVGSVADLAGRRVALPSIESFSSQWFLEHELPRNGLTQQDLSETHHFSHHHSVIAQVTNGQYDAGVSREYLLKELFHDGLRVVSYSVPIPSSPIAVTAQFDSTIITAIKSALLAVNRDESRRVSMTKDWDGEFVYGFVEASDADYDIIRGVVRKHQPKLKQ